MRVKINVKDYGVEKLVYGKKYYMAYAGVTYGEQFLFTKKNHIELCEYKEEEGKLIKISSYWVSRKELKRILNLGIIHWMGELD